VFLILILQVISGVTGPIFRLFGVSDETGFIEAVGSGMLDGLSRLQIFYVWLDVISPLAFGLFSGCVLILFLRCTQEFPSAFLNCLMFAVALSGLNAVVYYSLFG
jgi:hypothetical protein